MKKLRKVMMGFFLFAVCMTIVAFAEVDGSHVYAAEGDITVSEDYIAVEYTAENANKKIGQNAPATPENYSDWIFAGWYKENTCKTPIKSSGVTANCYAKFVPQDVLSVKCQTKVVTAENAAVEKSNLRFVTTIDSTNYESIGFEIVRDVLDAEGNVTGTKPYSDETQTSFKRIVASSGAKVDFEYSPKVISTKSEAFVTYTIANIPENYYDVDFLVRPYWITLDNVKVYGVSRYVAVSDYEADVVNIPVKVEAGTYAAENFKVYRSNSEAMETIQAVRYREVDGQNYVSIILSSAQNTSSATKYVVKDSSDTELCKYIYRNLDTEYNGSNADTSWYTVAKDVDSSETEFVIATSADLYGVASYVNGQTKVNDNLELFADKTIYVVSDIAINTETSVDWETGTVATDATAYPWNPIGTNSTNYFAGNFDGQGHTISGLYCSGSDLNVGLFGYAHPDSIIQNLAVKKSYFEYTGEADGSEAVGSIVGVGNGTVSNAFSSATIKGVYNLGGIVGYVGAGFYQAREQEKITGCWFDGKIVSNNGYNIGGILGRIQGDKANNLIPELDIINCLNSGQLSTTNTSVGRVAGILGCANQYCEVRVSYCMNNGTLSGNNKAISGMVAYKGTAGVTIVLGEGVYRTDATTYTNVSGCDTTDTIKQTDIYGYSALKKTSALDFNNVWIARKDATPVLKNWVTEDALYTPDTSFTKASGTENDPYQIRTPQQLYAMAYLVNGEDGTTYEDKYFEIAKDIKINAGAAENWETKAPKYTWIPIDEFKGSLDGGKHTVTGVYVSSTEKNTGLIRKATLESIIADVVFENSYIISNQDATGSIVGVAQGTLSNIYSDAFVKGTSNVGGIAGYVVYDDTNAESKANFNGCWFDGSVTANNIHVGGILGGVNKSGSPTVMEHCLNTGIVSTSEEQYGRVGGLCGNVNSNAAGLTILNSLNAGTVSGVANVGSVLGIIQNNKPVTIENTYSIATSTVNGIGSGSATTGAVYRLLEADMTGETACETMDLDFADSWTYIKDSTPELQWVSGKATDNMDSVEKVIDLSWYANPNESGEYVITDEKQLYGLSYIQDYSGFSGKTVKLNAADGVFEMNTGSATDWADGNIPNTVRQWRPIQNFAGTFNGNKNTVKGICYNGTESNIGFFGTTGNCTITNMRLENSCLITTAFPAGGIVGALTSGEATYSKLYSNAIVKASNNAGGILGAVNNTATKATMEECWNAGTVTVTAYSAGGIVGKVNLQDLTMNDCLNTGAVTSNERTGGLCGDVNSTSSNKATLKVSNGLNVGKLTGTVAVGHIYGNIAEYSLIAVDDVKNVYAVDVSDTRNTVGSNYAENPDAINGKLAKGNFKGYAAYNMQLQFNDSSKDGLNDGKWIARAYGTPELRYFAETGLYNPNMNITATDSVYTVNNVADLYGIAYLSAVNSKTFIGETIKLGATITVNGLNDGEKVADWATDAPAYEWIPIGQTTAFQGTFDGNGKTIEGVYCNSAYNSDTLAFVGLFGQTTNSLIKDLKLLDSYFTTSLDGVHFVGSIAGYASGTVEKIYTNATVHGRGQNNGGIVGGYKSGTNNTISECWFNGTVNGRLSGTGGIVGKLNNGTLRIEHCLTEGNVTGNVRVGGLCGEVNTSATLTVRDSLHTGALKATVTNTPYIGATVGYLGYASSSGAIGAIDVGAYTTHADDSSMSSINKYPSEYTGAGTVIGSVLANSDIDGQKGYDNTQLIFDRPETEDVEEGKWVTRNEDTPALKYFVDEKDVYEFTGYRAAKAWHNDPVKEGTYDVYEIDTVDELLGVSALVADGNTCFTNEKILVTADIAVNPKESVNWSTGEVKDDTVVSWTPIGSSTSKYFAGILDGGDYTISGLYYKSTGDGVGLVGVLHPDGVVQNLKLKDSFFESTNGWYIGSIAGYGNGSVINVYSNATVKGAYNSGGIIGQVHGAWWYGDKDGRTVSNCWYEGNVIVNNIHAGGIIGAINGYTDGTSNYNIDVTIEHCLNTGNITANATSNSRAGGLIGNVQGGTPSITITDCLNTGTIKGNSESGSALGIVQAGTVTVTDVYTASDSAGKSIGSGDAKVSGTINNQYTKNGMRGYALCTANTLNIETKSGLDFYVDNSDSEDKAYWTAKVDGTPSLKYFDDAGLYEMDIDWDVSDDGNTYTISTVAELYGLAMLSNATDFSGKTIQVDETVSELVVNTGQAATYKDNNPKYVWIPIGGVNAAKTFKGSFNGNGVTISGLYCDMTGNHTGMFAATNGCTIQNFSLVNSYFATAANYAGSISSYAEKITLSDIYSNAIVYCKGNLENYGFAGGFVGMVLGGADVASAMTGCWFDGSVTLEYEKSISVGGLIGKMNPSTVTLTNCLNSGTVTGNGRVGGLVGDVNMNTTLNIVSCMNTGVVNGKDEQFIRVDKKAEDDASVAATVTTRISSVGSLVGYSTDTTSKINYTNTYAVNDETSYDIGNNVIESHATVTGDAIMSGRSPLLGYTTNVENNYKGNEDTGLDFASTWALRKVDGKITVGLAQFVDNAEKITANMDAEVGLGFWGNAEITLKNAYDYGDGNYVLTVSNSTQQQYSNYISALTEESYGFTVFKNNHAEGALATDEGIYNTVLTKDDWVVNVTFVNAESKTYISVSCTAQPLSQHLKNAVDYTTTSEEGDGDGYTATLDNTTLHMPELCWYYGNSFVIQLKNGHFIVVDGGVEQELPYLLDYLEEVVGDETKKPIIEAWIISHTHRDHAGALVELIKNNDGDAKRVYVEGIYYNEPNQELHEDEDATRWAYKYQYNDILEMASKSLNSTTGYGPEVYRMQTGQRFYFNDITMDIVLAQEQVYLMGSKSDGYYSNYNDTSTWCMFNIDGEKVLIGGDGYLEDQNYIYDVYSDEYLDVDVFTALHHGANILLTDNERSYGTNSPLREKLTVKDIVLNDHRYNMTDSAYNDYFNTSHFDARKELVNDAAGITLTDATGEVTDDYKHLYSGQGTSILTFHPAIGESESYITAKLLAKRTTDEWKYCIQIDK